MSECSFYHQIKNAVQLSHLKKVYMFACNVCIMLLRSQLTVSYNLGV
jgi:hypothetical protein